MTAIRAAQALAILDQLEKLPAGTTVYIDRDYRGATVTVMRVDNAGHAESVYHHGDDVTDALGQCAQCLIAEGAA